VATHMRSDVAVLSHDVCGLLWVADHGSLSLAET
jgi:hypothetical protein